MARVFAKKTHSALDLKSQSFPVPIDRLKNSGWEWSMPDFYGLSFGVMVKQ
jgi:hypothetical protein